MTEAVSHYHDLVVETCYKCAVKFGMPRRMEEDRRESKDPFWCPNGHQQAYVESTADKLRRERDSLKQQMARREEEILALNRQVEREQATAARETRARRRVEARISKGICPHCNRTFADLARHMDSKHNPKCEAVHAPLLLEHQTP